MAQRDDIEAAMRFGDDFSVIGWNRFRQRSEAIRQTVVMRARLLTVRRNIRSSYAEAAEH